LDSLENARATVTLFYVPAKRLFSIGGEFTVNPHDEGVFEFFAVHRSLHTGASDFLSFWTDRDKCVLTAFSLQSSNSAISLML
jgi:hypothetical protein